MSNPNEIENLNERLAQGVDYFNREYYFEAHDEFEELWMDAREQTGRNLFHGLVNIATGFYHYRMGNLKGMQSQIGKGLEKLARVPDEYMGVDVANLTAEVRNYIKCETGENGFREPLPRIEFDERKTPGSIC